MFDPIERPFPVVPDIVLPAFIVTNSLSIVIWLNPSVALSKLTSVSTVNVPFIRTES